MNREIVVDACVACSADSETERPDRRRSCREVLLAIQQARYAIAFNGRLLEEWDKHQSKFAALFRGYMTRRRRIRIQSIDGASIRKRFRQQQTGMALEAMLKDLHLLETALASAMPTVVSRDSRIRDRYCDAAALIPDLQRIAWSDPDRPEHDTVEWLRAGAEPRTDIKLGYRQSR